MDQIIDSKKLAETEAIAKDCALVNQDRPEGRNYLLDHFLSKKAHVNAEQVLTAKKSTSSTTLTSTASSSSLGNGTSSGGLNQGADQEDKNEPKDKEN